MIRQQAARLAEIQQHLEQELTRLRASAAPLSAQDDATAKAIDAALPSIEKAVAILQRAESAYTSRMSGDETLDDYDRMEDSALAGDESLDDY